MSETPIEETIGYKIAIMFKPFIDPAAKEHMEIVKDMAKTINRHTYEQYKANKIQSCGQDLLDACEWSLAQFRIMSEAGKYPEHLLQENGGNGFTPLTSAIRKATS